MFTGIIEELGIVKKCLPLSGGSTLWIACERILDDLKPEDSIAVNGVCLTATRVEKDSFEATAVQETLNRTTLKSIKPGARVNLERALRFDSRLGGHLVQGHVDGIAEVRSIDEKGTGKVLQFSFSKTLIPYIVEKGSIAINGISLTVTGQHQDRIEISVIPFTIKNTNLQYLKKGDNVNIEVDILGKYVEKLIHRLDQNSGLDESKLRTLGY
jgi:riboflavin synthase